MIAKIMQPKHLLVILTIIASLLLYLNADNLQKIMGQDTAEVIATKNYFELFDPVDKPFRWNDGSLNEAPKKTDIVTHCQKDYRKAYDAELKLLRVVKGAADEHYYIFEALFNDDDIVVYVFDLQKNEILYKFFIPMA